jgi:hypothetical protein
MSTCKVYFVPKDKKIEPLFLGVAIPWGHKPKSPATANNHFIVVKNKWMEIKRVPRKIKKKLKNKSK